MFAFYLDVVTPARVGLGDLAQARDDYVWK